MLDSELVFEFVKFRFNCLIYGRYLCVNLQQVLEQFEKPNRYQSFLKKTKNSEVEDDKRK